MMCIRLRVHPQLEDVYKEISRVLKPGGLFASYEWVSTAKFDANNPEHVQIIDEINFGSGLRVRGGAGGACLAGGGARRSSTAGS
jgi:hypothetical protein